MLSSKSSNLSNADYSVTENEEEEFVNDNLCDDTSYSTEDLLFRMFTTKHSSKFTGTQNWNTVVIVEIEEMGNELLTLLKNPLFNVQNLSNNMKTIKKNLDKKLNLLTIKQFKLSNGKICYYHDL